MENFEAYYDEIEICGSAASSISERCFPDSQSDRWQRLQRSDLHSSYVDHTGGGSFQIMRYAQIEIFRICFNLP